MKICWDNLEDMKISIRGNLVRKGHIYIERESCGTCSKIYLTEKENPSNFCCHSCALKGKLFSQKHRKNLSIALTGRKLSAEHIRKMSEVTIGRICSEETRKKIGVGNKGKIISDKTREKMSDARKGYMPWCKGKNLSYEHRKKISKAHKGKKLSEEHKKNISAVTIGSGNPNWKGGISCEPYCDVWLDKEYKQSIKDRDGYKCLNPVCTKQHTLLHLHHINYNKKNCKPSNLITVCKSCNSKANYDRDWHKSWYQAIIKKRYGGK